MTQHLSVSFEASQFGSLKESSPSYVWVWGSFYIGKFKALLYQGSSLGIHVQKLSQQEVPFSRLGSLSRKHL